MDEAKIARRYAARWLLPDLLGMLPLEALFPEDHALSYLGPYRCRRGSRRCACRGGRGALRRGRSAGEGGAAARCAASGGAAHLPPTLTSAHTDPHS